MPIPMALGPFGFESLRFGYNGLGRDLSTRWADIQTVGGLDRLQWTGGEADTVTVDGVVFPEEFGGLASLAGVRAAALAGQVLPLVTLGGNVFGLYVIEGVSEDQSFHTASGLPRKDAFRIYLKRYTGTGFAPLSIVQALFG
ncbi:phage tail protein [Aurantimonas sp. MSK8Z-1]|uniref:phage tail protein n=1 Tax=Mangrovibrevibacter kandeliae TaxID=2968473 RepID=UPI0021178E22|nr:phage tail protein [Aurantimonas sp. MSK8Z-1]MCW4114731.1 phage tail protein [Aurantimonas sp. MSK8Z-1]